MTISTRRTEAGFTLTEVIISASLSTVILAGVLSAFLLLGRTAYSAAGYSELDANLRRGLVQLGTDARGASDIHWNSAQSVTLTVPNSGTFTYAYDSDGTSATYQCFYRVAGDGSSSASRVVLVRRVGSDFSFQRFKLATGGDIDQAAANDLETKLLGVQIRAVRSGVTAVNATQNATSARFILRNKRVSS